MKVLAPIVIVSALLLSGCSFFAPQPDGLKAGTCLSDREGTEADRTSVVPCTEDHLFDVAGTATWPGMDAAIADSDAEAVWNQLSKGNIDEYWSDMAVVCDDIMRRVVGFDGIAIDEYDATALDIRPAGIARDISVAARADFIAGDHTSLCSYGWSDFEGEEISVAFPPGIGLAGYASAGFPSDLHVCAKQADEADANVFLDCAEPHESQQLLVFVGRDVVGGEWIETVDPETFDAPDYTVPDSICADLVAQAFPTIDQGAGWFVWSNIFVGTSGWEDFDGTYDPEARYAFTCDLNTPDESSYILGDAFSGTATIVDR